MASGREIIFEFHKIGSYMKVTAMDVESQIETSITGTTTASKEYLERLARDKLILALKKKGIIT